MSDNQEDRIAGILWIGDPHLFSKKPGRRLDQSFLNTVLDKLDQALVIARNKKYQVVILGDLFERSQDNDLVMLSRLFRLLRQHNRRGGYVPLVLTGNHDLRDVVLSENTALSVVAESGLADVFAQCEVRIVPDVAILVAIPYGFSADIFLKGDGKKLLENAKKTHPNLPVIAVTHGDYAFTGAYPGACELTPLQGVDGVVNGHMHKTAEDVLVKNTLWMNPGNITRMSVDMESQHPAVWCFSVPESVDAITAWNDRLAEVTKANGNQKMGKNKEFFLQKIPLIAQENVFDHTGLVVSENNVELVNELQRHHVSESANKFLDLLKADRESVVTEDGSEVWNVIKTICEEQQVDTIVVDVLESLLPANQPE